MISLADYMAGVSYPEAVEAKRVALEIEVVEGNPRFSCPWCEGAMVLRSTRTQDKTEDRFYFKHKHDTGECSGKAGQSAAAICAMKYARAKEGARHKQIKQWVLESLAADSSFSNVDPEKRWTSVDGTKWRQPDVQATWRGQRVALEVQLSTTFLHVIAERMSFYRGEGGRLVWLFGELDPAEFRMAEDDLFYSNNRNAFRVSPESVAASKAQGRFVVECAWHEPGEHGDTLRRAMVGFEELTLDISPSGAPRAYYFDYAQAEADLDEAMVRQRQEKDDQALRDAMEAHMVAFRLDGDDAAAWSRLRQRFARRGFTLPQRLYVAQGVFYLLQAAYSAKRGEPVATSVPNLMSVANNLFSRHKEVLWVFTVLLGHYNHGSTLIANGNKEAWLKKRDRYRQAWLDEDPEFEPDGSYDDLLAFLFPEAAEMLRASPASEEVQRRARQGSMGLKRHDTTRSASAGSGDDAPGKV